MQCIGQQCIAFLLFTLVLKEGEINYSGPIILVASFKQCKQVLTWGEFQKVGYAIPDRVYR